MGYRALGSDIGDAVEDQEIAPDLHVGPAVPQLLEIGIMIYQFFGH